MNLFRERLKTKLVKSFMEVKQVNELERFVTIRISKVGDNAVSTAIYTTKIREDKEDIGNNITDFMNTIHVEDAGTDEGFVEAISIGVCKEKIYIHWNECMTECTVNLIDGGTTIFNIDYLTTIIRHYDNMGVLVCEKSVSYDPEEGFIKRLETTPPEFDNEFDI